jgi:predicted CopG family antitoxin
MYICDNVARQISVSDDVYEEMSKLKGDRSFSEFIREKVGISKNNKKILRFAGILKKDSKKLNELKKVVAKEREENYGREFSW